MVQNNLQPVRRICALHFACTVHTKLKSNPDLNANLNFTQIGVETVEETKRGMFPNIVARGDTIGNTPKYFLPPKYSVAARKPSLLGDLNFWRAYKRRSVALVDLLTLLTLNRRAIKVSTA